MRKPQSGSSHSDKPAYRFNHEHVSNKINANRPTEKHIIIKMAKLNDKKRILKAAREKQSVTYKGTPIRLSDDFSTEKLQARTQWQDISKILKGKNL